MGPIEEAVRKEVPEGSALAEIAYKLALTLDAGDGSTAMARELRAVLGELRQQRPWANDASSFKKERKRQAKWAMMQEGEWEWSDEADDWIRIDEYRSAPSVEALGVDDGI
jgi:hypothetical protein